MTYSFHELDSIASASYNKLYVEAFMKAMNMKDFVKHALVPGAENEVDTQGWSYGRAPRYFDGRVTDGRVTTRQISWVFARKEASMPEGALAMVYFSTFEDPIGYIVKE